MAKKQEPKPSYQEEMQALDVERIKALEDRDGPAYAHLCDELGIVDHEDSELYELGLFESRRVEPSGEFEEDFGELEQVVKAEDIVIDDKRFGDVTRSYLAPNNCRAQGNLKTDNHVKYADWIASAFLDSTQRQNGYGVRVDSSSGVSSGRMRRVYMGALFYERLNGRGRYGTEYSSGFEEDHDDMDRTKPEDYQNDQLELLRGLVSQRLPDANVVIRDKRLYVFKRE